MKKMVHLVQKLAQVVIVLALTFASTPAALSSQSAQDDVTPMIHLPLVLRNITWASVDPSGQTVTFWHNHSGSRQEALQTIIIDEFNATNPWDITVVQEYKGSYGDIYTQMLAVLNTEAAPDLVVAYQNQAATYQLSNALVDMTSLVESGTWGLTAEDQADILTGSDVVTTLNSLNSAANGTLP